MATERDLAFVGLIPNEVVNLMFDGEGMSIARAWREHLGPTQAELATRAGISQPGLARMEAARSPRKATRIKLAAALGLEVEQLLTLTAYSSFTDELQPALPLAK